MAKHLSVVPPSGSETSAGAPSEVYDLGKGPESVADRVKRLQQEAKILAQEEVETLERQMEALAAHAKAIAEGGDAYPAGVRDLAGRIAADIDQKAHMLQALLERTAGL
jgi:DNA-binding ferritin-like protein